MKRFFLAATFALIAHAASAETIDLSVKGMTCSSCAQAIEASLYQESAVLSVTVDVPAGSVIVVEKPAKSISDSTLSSRIREAGYRVSSITRRAL